MATYSARVYFTVLEFEADSPEHANKVLDELIDDFSQVDTAVGWDDVDWTLTEEN